MQYKELNSAQEIKSTIEDIKKSFRDFSKLLIPNERQRTVRGHVVLTLYYELKPAIKVEGEEKIIEQFVQKLEDEKKGY